MKCGPNLNLILEVSHCSLSIQRRSSTVKARWRVKCIQTRLPTWRVPAVLDHCSISVLRIVKTLAERYNVNTSGARWGNHDNIRMAQAWFDLTLIWQQASNCELYFTYKQIMYGKYGPTMIVKTLPCCGKIISICS